MARPSMGPRDQHTARVPRQLNLRIRAAEAGYGDNVSLFISDRLCYDLGAPELAVGPPIEEGTLPLPDMHVSRSKKVEAA